MAKSQDICKVCKPSSRMTSNLQTTLACPPHRYKHTRIPTKIVYSPFPQMSFKLCTMDMAQIGTYLCIFYPVKRLIPHVNYWHDSKPLSLDKLLFYCHCCFYLYHMASAPCPAFSAHKFVIHMKLKGVRCVPLLNQINSDFPIPMANESLS